MQEAYKEAGMQVCIQGICRNKIRRTVVVSPLRLIRSGPHDDNNSLESYKVLLSWRIQSNFGRKILLANLATMIARLGKPKPKRGLPPHFTACISCSSSKKKNLVLCSLSAEEPLTESVPSYLFMVFRRKRGSEGKLAVASAHWTSRLF